MKKSLLPLLVLVICTGIVHGMEPEHTQEYMETLPSELKVQIASALRTSTSLSEAIQNILILATINNEFYELINNSWVTRTIIQDLAKKFNVPTALVAQKLNTPGAQNYIAMSIQLPQAKTVQDAQKLISQGADIQFQGTDTEHNNILTKTIFLEEAPLDVIKLMVTHGSDTNYCEKTYIKDFPPLMAAIIKQMDKKRHTGHYDIKTIELLLAHNANPNITISDKCSRTNTPLLMASAFGLVDIVILLLNAPITPNAEQLQNALIWVDKGLKLNYSTAQEAQKIKQLLTNKLKVKIKK